MPRPVVLIIRDGWGLNDKQEGNAVAAANTTNTDYYKQNYPWTILDVPVRRWDCLTATRDPVKSVT